MKKAECPLAASTLRVQNFPKESCTQYSRLEVDAEADVEAMSREVQDFAEKLTDN